MTPTTWTRSAQCASGACLETTPTAGGMAVRNSLRPETVLVFDEGAWAGLLADVRAGRLDRPAAS